MPLEMEARGVLRRMAPSLPVVATAEVRLAGRDEWLTASLDDEVTPAIAGLGGEPFALVTLHRRIGGPRPVGAQMVVTADRRWGFLSGGCVEADVEAHARAALRDGRPRHLTYGQGSPFFDIRLPCGGRIDLMVEAIRPGDPAIARLLNLTARRRPARYLSDGERRWCVEPGAIVNEGWTVDRTSRPTQRLAVIGSDPFAVAIAVAGWQQGWQVCLTASSPPAGRSPPGLDVVVARPAAALATLAPDAWTAIAVATHDVDEGDEALVVALRSRASYVGALGSRRRLEERRRTLSEAGLPMAAWDRLRAPIGLPIGARSPREIGAAAIAEIIALRPRDDT